MFVLTAKLSKPKLIAAGLILLAAVLLIVLLVLSGDGGPSALPEGGTNDQRLAYLATYGWSVNAMPTESQKVKIPDTADNAVFARYNDLQKSQGFDLTDYAGKEVMRYVYEVLNYPDAADKVYATVLVHEGYIIGGDVTDTATDGLIHGFRAPNNQDPQQSTESTGDPSNSEPSETESAEPTEASEP
ncbi:MAG: DUF4830 domain-containing protein [Oscillospiraceae bacterium]|nr:DUF4830 domain-containing protein [Oscillospiraceae bacterium]